MPALSGCNRGEKCAVTEVKDSDPSIVAGGVPLQGASFTGTFGEQVKLFQADADARMEKLAERQEELFREMFGKQQYLQDCLVAWTQWLSDSDRRGNAAAAIEDRTTTAEAADAQSLQQEQEKPKDEAEAEAVSKRDKKEAAAAAPLLEPTSPTSPLGPPAPKVVVAEACDPSHCISQASHDSGKTCSKEEVLDVIQKGSISARKLLEEKNGFYAETMHSVNTLMHDRKGALAKFVGSKEFDCFWTVIIFCFAAYMGVEAQLRLLDLVACDEPALAFVGYTFGILFFLELTLRLAVVGVYGMFHPWSGFEWWWLRFDAFVTILWIIEVSLSFAQDCAEGGGGLAPLQALKLLRLTRVGRVLKMFHLSHLRELRLLVYCLWCSMKSLCWSVLLIFMITYIFAIFFAEGVVNLEKAPEGLSARLLFDGIFESMLTLYMAISGGKSWGDIYYPIRDEMPAFYALLFLMYVTFCVYAMINIITASFVTCAVDTAQNEKEMRIRDKLAQKKEYMEAMQQMFKDMDYDGSATISYKELEKFLQDERMQALLLIMELDVGESAHFFDLIDIDGTGEIDIGEFVAGTMKLKGQAANMDIAEVHKSLNTKIVALQKSLETEVPKRLATLLLAELGGHEEAHSSSSSVRKRGRNTAYSVPVPFSLLPPPPPTTLPARRGRSSSEAESCNDVLSM